jgi:hypothetical protein
VNLKRIRDCRGLIRDMMDKNPQNDLWVGELIPLRVLFQPKNTNGPKKSQR